MILDNPISLKSQICERLKAARYEAGFRSSKEFALTHELKVSTYNLHEAGTRSMGIEVIEHYAALLNLNVSWLISGIGPKHKSQVRSVPIISWEEVAHYPQNIKTETKDWTTSDIDLSPLSFALVMDNDSMEPRYPEGTIIIIDKMQKPKTKDYAVIQLKDKKVPVFKQLVLVDGELYAKSLNPDYKPIRLAKGTHIIGRVVQAKLVC
ncbi:MAG: LexA family transcriptional regulator [Proteobacteria bacterium]|nr:LexA family transcriptional regulator [Pseudomonadota bacterium]